MQNNIAHSKSGLNDLFSFYGEISTDHNVLLVVGGGTAAYTYLYTADIASRYTHVIILGGHGYWQKAEHPLAQPLHIHNLPHMTNDYIHPVEHDQRKGLTPHHPNSAYAHSYQQQEKLEQLVHNTHQKLKHLDVELFYDTDAYVSKIDRVIDSNDFLFNLASNEHDSFMASSVVVATGVGPARKLDARLFSDLSNNPSHQKRIIDYTEILSPCSAGKCHNQKIFIYGGGATAAWVMEVAQHKAEPVGWVSRAGFQDAEIAGPRVTEIIEQTRSLQQKGEVDSIEKLGDGLLITVNIGQDETQQFYADYFVSCIGQEVYEIGGLPHILSETIMHDLKIMHDKNRTTGTDHEARLGWCTGDGQLQIIGAAEATFYKRNHRASRPNPVSDILTKSAARAAITVGGVVASICALTNYMPFLQDPETGQIKLLGLNVNVMNASQLAVYWTACYACATPQQINGAVDTFIGARCDTEFGLSPKAVADFEREHFGKVSMLHADKPAANDYNDRRLFKRQVSVNESVPSVAKDTAKISASSYCTML